jgi:hypothetical protein
MSSDDSDGEELEKLKAKAPVCIPSASVPLRLCLYSSGFVAALEFPSSPAVSSLAVSSAVAFSLAVLSRMGGLQCCNRGRQRQTRGRQRQRQTADSNHLRFWELADGVEAES